MNYDEILGNELTLLLQSSARYPNLQKIIEQNIHHVEWSILLQQLLPNIASSKNNKIVLQTISLIQKIDQAHKILTNDMGVILEFFQNLKSYNEENIQIKLVSTLLHLISPQNIDFANINTIINICNLLLQFSASDNPIINQSSIQGLITLTTTLEEQLIHSSSVVEVYFQLLDIFYQIFTDKPQEYINCQFNSFLAKDIFIMFLKSGRIVNQTEQFQQFYHGNLFQYINSIDLSQENNILLKISKIRLIFHYIYVVEDKILLLESMMEQYAKLPTFDIAKIAIHDGILFLYSDINIFISLLQNKPTNIEYTDFNELIMKQLFVSTLNLIQECQNQPSPKQTNIVNRYSAQYLEYNIKLIPNQMLNQTKLLIITITDNLGKMNNAKDDKENIQQLLNQQIMVKEDTQVEDNITQYSYEEANNDESKLKTLLDKLWRPILKIMKLLLKISDNTQFAYLLQYVIQWIKICLAQNQLQGFQQLIRFIASLSAPQQLKFIDTDKWIIAYQQLSDQILNHLCILSAKTWNVVFQTLQRIEQVITKDFESKFSTNLFINSMNYPDQTIFSMLDGLNQLALQVSERLQISSKKNFDSIYKSFAIEKLYLIVNCNWFRIYKFWSIIEALNICLCGSKVMEMRLNAVNCLKEIIFSGFDYFCQKQPEQQEWSWTLHLLNPISELVVSQFEDVVENVMHLLLTLIREQSKFFPPNTFNYIIRVLEKVMSELLLKTEACFTNQDIQPAQAKSLFLRIVLSLNCLSEIVFNRIDQLDKQSVLILASIMVSLNGQEQFNSELQNKIICMTWQVQEQILKLGLSNPKLLEISLKLIKDCTSGLDDLRYASVHIATQLCLAAQDSIFDECFDVLEELIQTAMNSYLKLEHSQIQIIYQTPRFSNIPIDTPKFQSQKSPMFDKTTSLTIFRQLLELIKLCIVKITEIIITKKKFKKFYYYLTLFNQAQCYYLKHEIILVCLKMIKEYQEIQLQNMVIDYCCQLMNQEHCEFDDIQFYLENLTLTYICEINLIAFQKEHKKRFIMLQNILQYYCSDSLLTYISDENNVYKYYLKNCLQIEQLSQEQLKLWLHFCDELLSHVAIQAKFHNLIDFLMNVLEKIFGVIQNIQEEYNHVQKLFIQLNHLLNQCQKINNDHSERMLMIITSKFKIIILVSIHKFESQQIHQLLKPIILTLFIKQGKKNSEWVQFILEEISISLEGEKYDSLVNLVSDHYGQQLQSDTNWSIALNLINMFQQQGKIIEELRIKLNPQLLDNIKKTLERFVDNDNFNYEQQYNVEQMLNYLEQQEQVLIQPFYTILIEMIKTEQLEIRLKLIRILHKLQK